MMSQNVGNHKELPANLDMAALLQWCDWAHAESERIKRRMKRQAEGLKRMIDEFRPTVQSWKERK